MLAYHGLADGIIPTKGTEAYYNAVAAILPDIQSFYRYYPVPGLGHCFGGLGQGPTTLFDAMRAWVENGTIPEELPVSFTDTAGQTNNRFLYPYPAQTIYNSTYRDSIVTKCFYCA
ncbi:hypothetical protein VPNG_04902 [Cytospora leucostoma]|uniref:Carboxylic ester hydrolase n=1 Tax=Cytospora leucostoma TaxID=1230097 RepID=A0A423X7H8_9PEZI|nr:hypothetical protein VPNG_04902 [Cytospora leucostoma]